MTDLEHAFRDGIRAAIAAHPEWLGSALSAVAAGMSDAIASERRDTARKDIALRSALALAGPKRLSPEVLNLLNTQVLLGIEHEKACQIEREWIVHKEN